MALDLIYLFVGILIGSVAMYLIKKSTNNITQGIDPQLFTETDKQKAIALQQLADAKMQI